jgi:FkbM family methyltransferase
MSSLALRLFEVQPELGRWILRGFCHSQPAARASHYWLLDTLKRRLVPDPATRRVSLGERLLIEVDLSSAAGRDIYYHGSYDLGIARFCERFLKPGMHVVDAGANVGEFSLRAARRVGTGGRVLAIEASPDTAVHLERNVALNRLDQVRVVRAAVCEDESERSLYLGGGPDSGSSSLSQPHDYAGKELRVPGVTLDRLVESELAGRVDLIKLDVEGAEMAALEGAQGLLTCADRPVVIVEYHSDVARRSGWSLADLRSFLESRGYRLQLLCDSGEPAEFRSLTERVSDLVAIPAA